MQSKVHVFYWKLKLGLEEGQMAHVGDTMKLFNRAWNAIPRSSVIKCWIKSQYFAQSNVLYFKSILYLLSRHIDVDIDLSTNVEDNLQISESVIGQEMTEDMTAAVSQYIYLPSDLSTPLHEILEQDKDLKDESDLTALSSLPSPQDLDLSRDEISKN